MSTAPVSRMADAHHKRLGQHGISLIELMIAMAIGLLTTLAISGVMLATEQQRREATSGSDAQVNGALALYTMQRDLQMGGYGLTSIAEVSGCTIKSKKGTAPTVTQVLAPVVITDGANNGPDTIDIGSATHREFSVPMKVAVDHTRGGDTFTIADKANIGNSVGDFMIAVPTEAPSSTAWCSLFQVSELPTGNTLRHAASDAHPWNHAAPDSIFPGVTDADVAYPVRSFLVNLGRLVSRTYSIRDNSTLQLQTVVSDAVADTQDVLPNIVGLQAVYGKDTTSPPDRTADVWNATTPTTPEQWNQVVAVRIAIVARSVQFDKEEVTAALPQWRPDGQTETDIRIDLANPADWKHYRYHVYETAVPLRNMLWQSKK
jgi:type IV pilus assembly protein PilW